MFEGKQIMSRIFKFVDLLTMIRHDNCSNIQDSASAITWFFFEFTLRCCLLSLSSFLNFLLAIKNNADIQLSSHRVSMSYTTQVLNILTEAVCNKDN